VDEDSDLYSSPNLDTFTDSHAAPDKYCDGNVYSIIDSDEYVHLYDHAVTNSILYADPRSLRDEYIHYSNRSDEGVHCCAFGNTDLDADAAANDHEDTNVYTASNANFHTDRFSYAFADTFLNSNEHVHVYDHTFAHAILYADP
jgi:hypothetical protein